MFNSRIFLVVTQPQEGLRRQVSLSLFYNMPLPPTWGYDKKDSSSVFEGELHPLFRGFLQFLYLDCIVMF